MEVIIKINIDDPAGKITVESTKAMTEESMENRSYSQYARFFDESCPNWDKNPEHNLTFLLTQQNYANDKLRVQGYLFLNDVYNLLGLPRTEAGQLIGWIYDPKNPDHIGDNYVDFGIYNTQAPLSTRLFVNGYEKSVLLDFNVDGIILDKIN